MAQVLVGLRPRDHFRAPVFCGEGDVELFLGQFNDVAVANRWGDQAALLHLRAHLEGTACACGAGSNRDRVEDALRARFGLSQHQAKDRLIHLKRDAKATLHEQAMDVQRLVDIAYPRLSRVDKEQMAMDHLLRALDNKALQRHMLTIVPESVVDLVQAIDEYLAIGGVDVRHPTVSARVVEAEGPTIRTWHPCQGSRGTRLASYAKLLEKVEALEASRAIPSASKESLAVRP